MKTTVDLPVYTDYNPRNDVWDPIRSLTRYGRHTLTSVEMTVSNRCNMRCEHCAVGDSLSLKEDALLPLSLILNKLEEVEHLETISITGGEPSYSMQTMRSHILPILKYAKDRGIRSQMNSNLTLDLGRYEEIAPYLDVMHISYNYKDAHDFHEMGFARTAHGVTYETASKLFDRMLDNTRALARGGLFISAESMINYRTHLHLPEMHRMIVELGCMRHEVHPMYPSSFAANLPVLPLADISRSIANLLDHRIPGVWMLFGTLPFFGCSTSAEDRALIRRLHSEPNVTVRNDPDGRNRLNLNVFDGNVFVTDFSDLSALGNIRTDTLDQVFERWLAHPLAASVNCHCPAVSCCGPNLLVADTYYKGTDFTKRSAQ